MQPGRICATVPPSGLSWRVAELYEHSCAVSLRTAANTPPGVTGSCRVRRRGFSRRWVHALRLGGLRGVDGFGQAAAGRRGGFLVRLRKALPPAKTGGDLARTAREMSTPHPPAHGIGVSHPPEHSQEETTRER